MQLFRLPLNLAAIVLQLSLNSSDNNLAVCIKPFLVFLILIRGIQWVRQVHPSLNLARLKEGKGWVRPIHEMKILPQPSPLRIIG